MRMVIEGLGKKLEKITTRFEVATATKDIPYTLGENHPGGGVIKQGTVGGQHFEWTGWVDGAPFMIFHFYWQMGTDIEPLWEPGDNCYRVVMHGNPPLEVKVMGLAESDGHRPFNGLPWTGLVGATAVPAVCDARPGLIDHIDLGVVQPHGLVRPAAG